MTVYRRCSATSSGRPTGRPKTSADSSGRAADNDQFPAAAAAASPCWAMSPGEAWAGSDQSVFVPRPLSAGPFHRPAVRTEFINSDANLSPQDPAVPLIEAIRKELDRFPSPHADSSRWLILYIRTASVIIIIHYRHRSSNARAYILYYYVACSMWINPPWLHPFDEPLASSPSPHAETTMIHRRLMNDIVYNTITYYYYYYYVLY